MKIPLIGAELLRADGRTDVPKLTVAFGNFVNVPKNHNAPNKRQDYWHTAVSVLAHRCLYWHTAGSVQAHRCVSTGTPLCPYWHTAVSVLAHPCVRTGTPLCLHCLYE